MQERTDLEAKAKVLELIKDTTMAMMATREGGTGALRSRPMAYRSVEFDGDLWFFTRGSSRKVDDIKAAPETLLTFADPKSNDYVSITGRAEVVTDRAKVNELWAEVYRTWFPKGPDDPDVVLIRVHVERADYWDAPSSAMVYAYGYVKARLTGEPPHPGEVGAVRFT